MVYCPKCGMSMFVFSTIDRDYKKAICCRKIWIIKNDSILNLPLVSEKKIKSNQLWENMAFKRMGR